ncbi:hypothetical protein [Nocardioides sp. LHG3406-4]|uniref:hypothetical protein n=1 Tax=Nocardioides sp. LHG3406-4 TaxID=2804575 RepID=UPI003CF0F2A3
MRRTTMILMGLCLAVTTLAGCADDKEPAAHPSSHPTSSVDITFSGDSVEPNGERIEVEAGEPLTLNVTADAPGEIHVHSTPEQELEYDAGTTKLELTIDQPGVVDVESHHLDVTILQLEVR